MPPNQRDSEQREFRVWIKEETYMKLKRLSEIRQEDMSKIVRVHIEEITSKIKLNAQDYAIITSNVAAREEKQRQKNSKRKP